MRVSSLLFLSLLMTSCSLLPPDSQDVEEKMNVINEYSGQKAEALFAGGCFWCTESDYEKIPGVITVISGFSGGNVKNPSYKQVSAGDTGHIESILVTYDPTIVSYRELVDHLWKVMDPTDNGGQFNDRGYQYTSAIFYQTEEEKRIAEESKKAIENSGRFDKPIVTPIVAAGPFYPAEEYHQDYYKKNPLRYKYYRHGSGRDTFIESIWSKEVEDTEEEVQPANDTAQYTKPSDAELREMLTDLQYKVTQLEGTEKPFENAYWDNKEEGVYVDIVSKEPLFSSTHKYKSGTGWPTFDRPLEPENIVEKADRKLFVTRTEIRSKMGDNHIGHVFTDGPEETTGLRYCMNSAALEFIPKQDLVERGLEKYLNLFE